MAKAIGPSFPSELQAAGLLGLPRLTMPRFRGLTDAHFAYIAGIVDGEDYVHIRKTFRKTTKQTAIYYDPHVRVSNTNQELVRWLQQTTGIGSVGVTDKRSNPRHKILWFWMTNSQQASTLLKRIRPWLLIKRKQADLIIRLCEIQRHRNNGHPFSDSERIVRRTLWEQCKMLNKKGRGHAT